MSIPYTKGWSATIDGSPAHIERVSVGFSGIVVPPGEHHLVMRYRTPGLLEGALVSAAGLVAFAGMVAGSSTRRRREAT